MNFDSGRFIAIYLGYAVPILLLYWVSRKMPRTWPAPPRIELARPWLDLLTAIGVVILIILLNVAYHKNLLLSGRGLLPGQAAFLVDLAIIWSPLALALLWRRQGLETCLVSFTGFPLKIAWAVGLSVVGLAVFLCTEGRFTDLDLAVTSLWRFDPIQMIQSILQFLGIGYLLVRIVGVTGSKVAISACALLYGLVKYPYYMGTYGMSFPEASGIIFASILVAFVVVYIILDREDILVVAIIHVFLDLIQNS